MVYDLLLLEEKTVRFPILKRKQRRHAFFSQSILPKNLFPPITYVNKQIHEETHSIIYGRTGFSYETLREGLLFLNRIGTMNTKNIKRFSVRDRLTITGASELSKLLLENASRNIQQLEISLYSVRRDHTNPVTPAFVVKSFSALFKALFQRFRSVEGIFQVVMFDNFPNAHNPVHVFARSAPEDQWHYMVTRWQSYVAARDKFMDELKDILREKYE